MRITLFILLLPFILNPAAHASERWFKPEIVENGRVLFQQTCAACHGMQAEGTTHWRQKDENGNYPPPPLDGSAHAWHHSIPQLVYSIKQCGVEYGGTMPGFADRYTDLEILALIAYFQSKWPDEIYRIWQKNHLPQ